MSNGVNLPEEVVVDILSRLPAKSLCRFRCVSNPWRTLISHPHFIKTHLNRNTHIEKLVIHSTPTSLYSINCSETFNNNDVIATELIFNFASMGFVVDIWGSCNGLILVVNERNSKILLNPSTKQFNELPESNLETLYASCHQRMYGLGYDFSTDDYKVVSNFSFSDESGCSETVVGVYSLRKNSWRCLRDVPYSQPLSGCHILWGAFVNGSIHWVGRRCDSANSAVIASFDLAREEFRDVPAPRLLNDADVWNSTLGVLGGCLVMTKCRSWSEDEVWVMKEYGVGESWTKFTICNHDVWVSKPLYMAGDGEFLMWMNEDKLVAYKSREGKQRHILLHGIPSMYGPRFVDLQTYVESLVSPRALH